MQCNFLFGLVDGALVGHIQVRCHAERVERLELFSRKKVDSVFLCPLSYLEQVFCNVFV